MRPIEMRRWDRGTWLDFITELFGVITPGIGKESLQDPAFKPLQTQLALTEWTLNRGRAFFLPIAFPPRADTASMLDTLTRMAQLPPNKADVLSWIKDELVEMPECHREPYFLDMGSECYPQEFAYLEERVGNYFALRKKHMVHQHGDTFRDFIAQVDTID